MRFSVGFQIHWVAVATTRHTVGLMLWAGLKCIKGYEGEKGGAENGPLRVDAAAGGGGGGGGGLAARGGGEGTPLGSKQPPPSQICPVGHTCGQPTLVRDYAMPSTSTNFLKDRHPCRCTAIPANGW